MKRMLFAVVPDSEIVNDRQNSIADVEYDTKPQNVPNEPWNNDGLSRSCQQTASWDGLFGCLLRQLRERARAESTHCNSSEASHHHCRCHAIQVLLE